MSALKEIIKTEIRAKGRITFSEFMELALYHPELGYYMSGKTRIGKAGDYYTSPSVTSEFGEVIAGFIAKAAAAASGNGLFVVESGGGRGLLAGDILNALKREHPELYNETTYFLIETSAINLKEAEKALRNHLPKVRFTSSISEIKPESIDGVIISNELVDALPFRRARYQNGALREIFVSLKDNEFEEIPDEPGTPVLIEYFNDYDIRFREDQEVEINLNAGRWLEEISKILRKGYVLTIDYGYLAPELYSPERLKGTFKCIHKHSINDDPYINIGEQDITAHVDFSNLIRTGESLGLKKVKYDTQGQFLIDWGILDLMMRESGQENASGFVENSKNIAIKNLFLPGSMGNSFKILLQKKNIDTADEILYPESPLKLSFGVI
jgi:SAM-dependent MidA family methyltransferase